MDKYLAAAPRESQSNFLLLCFVGHTVYKVSRIFQLREREREIPEIIIDQGCIIRQVTLDELQHTENVVSLDG